MPEDVDDRIRFVYSQLHALVNDLPQIAYERDVESFHELIDELESLGFKASRFKIDRDRDMFRRMTSISNRTGVAKYAQQYEVRHGTFGRQVKALFTFFELTQRRDVVNVSLPRGEG